jgi:hypothetical protein
VLWFFGILLIFCPIGWIIMAIKFLGRKDELECPNCTGQFYE